MISRLQYALLNFARMVYQITVVINLTLDDPHDAVTLWYSIYVALLNRSRNKISYQLTARLSLTSIPWRRGQHQFARLPLLPERMATQQTSSLPWNKRTKDLREISYLGVNKVVNATLKKYRRYLLPVLLVAALPLLTFISSGSTPYHYPAIIRSFLSIPTMALPTAQGKSEKT